MEENEKKDIKCVIWDLDNTIWDGILLESAAVRLKPGIKEILSELDKRGILHSIASKNNYADAISKLKEFGIEEYFLYPEIHWNAKSVSVANIQKNLNFGIDTFLFIDDQPFERDEVQAVHPAVECMDAAGYKSLLAVKRLNPRFITEDSALRRRMYQDDIKRKHEETEYQGTPEEFLATLNLHFSISRAAAEDLKRAEELTVRTHQLNATGVTYSYEELEFFRTSDKHLLLICELTDKYGSYGKIGLALLELGPTHWYLKLMLMSCRVMARGVGSVLMSYILNEAKKAGKPLLADFRQTDRNRQMYIAYKFGNFREIKNDGAGNIVFENDLSFIQAYPPYIKLSLDA